MQGLWLWWFSDIPQNKHSTPSASSTTEFATYYPQLTAYCLPPTAVQPTNLQHPASNHFSYRP